jgi:hypothetical protein
MIHEKIIIWHLSGEVADVVAKLYCGTQKSIAKQAQTILAG